MKGVSPAEMDRIRVQAEAEMSQRQRQGAWAGAMQTHDDYRTRPVEWIVEHLGIGENTIRWSLNPGYPQHKWDGDRDPIVLILEALARWEDVGCESATGTGKTFIAACITYWFLACWKGNVITAAPKEDQLLLHVWKELGRLWPRFERHFPEAIMTTGKIRMQPAEGDRESWAATAFVCGVGADEEIAQRAAGFHDEHQLWITEETPGIHSALMQTIEQTRTDDHNNHLALGNPDHRDDSLHRFCFNIKEDPQPGVKHIRISAFDHPNVVSGKSIVPGAIGQRRLNQRIEKLGRGSRLYQSRVCGICPSQSEDALIRWEWCVAAARKYDDPAYRVGVLSLGADVADAPEGDPAAIARFQGACCTEVESFQVIDAAEVGERLVKEANDKDNPVDPRYIGIDSVGVGSSAVNEAKRRGLKLRWISGATKSVPKVDTDAMWSVTEPDLEGNIKAKGPVIVEAERYANLRSQVLWKMREDLRMGRVALPWDEELFQDLCTATYGTPNGKITVEPKEKIIGRLKRSPNKGDACCYGNFVRPRVPLKRKVKDPTDAQVDSRDCDRGLERKLAAINKRHQKENARAIRRYRRRGLR